MKKIILALFVLIGIIAVFLVFPQNEHGVLYQPVQAFKKAFINPEPVTFFVVGDMMFDRFIRQKTAAFGADHSFSCIGDVFREADFVLGNLEGPITPYPSVSAGSEIGSPANFTFTFAPETAELLAKHNVTLVNLSNNHIGNFGRDGMHFTRQYLDAAGVHHFGGLSEDEPIYRTGSISFISYNEFGGDSVEKVAAKIQAEKQNENLVFVYTHWGAEYAEDVSSMQADAEILAAAGADIIFGSHPHVVLPSAKIGNTLVYYSLGNFIFDQYWDERVRTGLMLKVIVTGDEYVIEEIPVILNRDGTTCVK